MKFHDELKLSMHSYVRFVYRVTKTFPREEIYGITSQLRRSTLSIILNYIEGFARRTGPNCKTYKHFLSMSYGSLKESKYLLFLTQEEKYISPETYREGLSYADKIGKMIWPIMKNE